MSKRILLFLTCTAAGLSLVSLSGAGYLFSPVSLILAVPFYYLSLEALMIKADKRTKIITSVFSFIVSASLFTGKYTLSKSEPFSLYSLIYLAAMTFLIYIILMVLTDKLLKLRLPHASSVKYVFPISWAIIFVCWIPYFLAQFPGVITYDSIKQIQMALGNIPITDHHPVLHTILIKFSLFIGNGSPAAYSIIQMLILSSIFAFSIYWLAKKGAPRIIILISLLWFALNPLHGVYSVAMQKDVIFSGFLMLLTISAAEICISKGKCMINKTWIIMTGVSVMGVCFFRNNGALIVMALFITAFLLIKDMRKRVLITACMFFICLTVIKGPVFRLCGVRPAHFVESVGIPLQQIARAVKDNVLTAEEEAKISKYLPVEEVRAKYDPQSVDPLKSEVYGTHFNHEALEADKAGFFMLWAEMLLKYPASYANAYLDMTYGYWYPLTPSYTASLTMIAENNLGIEQTPLLPEQMVNTVRTFSQRCFDMKIPVLNIIFSAAGMIFICLYFCIPSLKKHGKYALLPYLPVFVLWATLLLAAPISTSLRYLYGAFTCLPVLMLIPFINLKNKT